MTAATLTRIPTGAVVASPDQNRTEFDPVRLRELADSIAELGLLQPIVVRSSTEASTLSGLSDSLSYTLIAGERRLRAVRDLLGWADVPAIVHDEPPDETAALRTLAENMIRQDPGPLEEARGLAQAGDRYGLEPAELARRLGKSARWVKDRLALLQLADDVAHFVQIGTLPIGRAVLISGLDPNRQRLAVQAHERGIGPDAFRALAARLADEQAADSMFDPDDFMRVDEYVVDAETKTAVPESQVRIVVRERPLGIGDIAELLEVRPGTVAQWRQRGIFPDIELTVGGSPAWWESTVLAWAQETGRS